MKHKILVIDDEVILTKTFSRLLIRQGYEVKTATGGEEACQWVREESFDLIMSDMRMPGKNGVEVAREIREIQHAQGMTESALIFLTGFADKDLEDEAQKLNTIAYIYKPFDAFVLLEVIAKYFNERL